MDHYFICPHCGAHVPQEASVCPECGSDDETGWSKDAAFSDLLLYDDEPQPARNKSAAWPTTVLGAVAALVLMAYLAYALPWGIYLIPLFLVIIGVLYYVSQVVPRQRHSREKKLYQYLLQKARGDRELVARLIEHEQRRNPGADRLKWMQDVIYYWERDSHQN